MKKTIAIITSVVILSGCGIDVHTSCQEDEAWTPVHHETPGAIEDSYGVSRMCVNVEDIVKQGVREWTDNGWGYFVNTQYDE